ncbi:hypothetical protein V8G54_003497 [Vigna mungo]|uniref:Uncharacterized protein n=1 Tax=Vigna mungo TaxID=3915 RepID=A0AAQ3PDZ7_VIGMU
MKVIFLSEWIMPVVATIRLSPKVQDKRVWRMDFNDCRVAQMESSGRGARGNDGGSSSPRSESSFSFIELTEGDKVDGAEEENEQVGAFPIVAGYDWASHDVNKFSTSFCTKGQLADWADHNCVLRSVEFGPLFKLTACEENKHFVSDGYPLNIEHCSLSTSSEQLRVYPSLHHRLLLSPRQRRQKLVKSLTSVPDRYQRSVLPLSGLPLIALDAQRSILTLNGVRSYTDTCNLSPLLLNSSGPKVWRLTKWSIDSIDNATTSVNIANKDTLKGTEDYSTIELKVDVSNEGDEVNLLVVLAFKVLCLALNLTLTPTLFLHHFYTCPNAKKRKTRTGQPTQGETTKDGSSNLAPACAAPSIIDPKEKEKDKGKRKSHRHGEKSSSSHKKSNQRWELKAFGWRLGVKMSFNLFGAEKEKLKGVDELEILEAIVEVSTRVALLNLKVSSSVGVEDLEARLVDSEATETCLSEWTIYCLIVRKRKKVVEDLTKHNTVLGIQNATLTIKLKDIGQAIIEHHKVSLKKAFAQATHFYNISLNKGNFDEVNSWSSVHFEDCSKWVEDCRRRDILLQIFVLLPIFWLEASLVFLQTRSPSLKLLGLTLVLYLRAIILLYAYAQTLYHVGNTDKPRELQVAHTPKLPLPLLNIVLAWLLSDIFNELAFLELHQLFVYKLSAIVSNDCVRKTEAAYDVFPYERLHLPSYNGCQSFCLYLDSKVVYGNKHKLFFSLADQERPNNINSHPQNLCDWVVHANDHLIALKYLANEIYQSVLQGFLNQSRTYDLLSDGQVQLQLVSSD